MKWDILSGLFSSFILFSMSPRRGLGEAVHLGFRVFLAVFGVLHRVGESHQRIGRAAHRVQRAAELVLEHSVHAGDANFERIQSSS